ncbi:TAF5-like RNA polymerase II p300/CBP-associated factor-associated factor 65 kDa subunit 5L [Ornithodoros turicata]|uniref:TAF5-like RNA polymerase II p300/CBP-associated factor-associated factor 65 kDa subunit 5L n=1 Tax=Ornithodoros turicata TaxID=34597 RepID=UPI003139E421
MKKNRSEMVASAVGRYLKGRQYMDSDSFKKSDLRLQQSLHDLALNTTIASETGTRNLVRYGCISKDATAIDHQFSSLKTFIADASEPFKSQLTFILFPAFVHLYLELINGGHKGSAQKFHARYRHMFQPQEQYRSVVDALPNVTSPSDVPAHPQVKEFRENKYSLRLSDDCLEYLLQFLKDSDHMILLQVVSLHIDIDVQVYPERTNGAAAPGLLPKVEKLAGNQESNKNKEATVLSLKQVIKKVRDGPPCLPSVCLYAVSQGTSGLCSAAQQSNGSLLACGFENSSVRLWNLQSQPLVSDTQNVDVSKVFLACDTDRFKDEENENFLGERDHKVLRGHAGPVYGLDFMPQLDILLSCSEDTTVRAWNLKTHSSVAIYQGHSAPIWSLDVGPMGLYFATASKDNSARIWTLERTYPLRILAGHNMDVDCVKFHPNSNYVATGSSDRCVRLWSVQEGRLVRSLPAHRGAIFALAFSPNGQYLASAGEDRRIKVWDLASASLLKELRGHTDAVYSLSFSCDSAVLASGGAEPQVRLWDLRKTSASHASAADSHNSPELMASLPSTTSALHLVRYATHNLLTLVGTVAAQT